MKNPDLLNQIHSSTEQSLGLTDKELAYN
jgi:malate dehydrogenase (quinone)